MSGQHVYKSTSRCSWSFKKNGKQSIGRSRGGLTTKIHLCSTSDRFALVFHLSAGNKNDAPEGRKLLRSIYSKTGQVMIIDRAYEDNATRALIKRHGFTCVVLPKITRKQPWEYDKEIYKRRNEIERYFCRLKNYRRVFTRYDKLDSIFISVIQLAMIFDVLLM